MMQHTRSWSTTHSCRNDRTCTDADRIEELEVLLKALSNTGCNRT